MLAACGRVRSCRVQNQRRGVSGCSCGASSAIPRKRRAHRRERIDRETAVRAESAVRRRPSPARAGIVSRILPWAVAALAIVVAGWMYARPGTGPAASVDDVLYVDLGSLPDVEFVRVLNGSFSVSPDSRNVAMIGVKGNARRLFVRTLGRPEAREIPNTLGVNGVAFSPDGASVVRHNGGS